MIRARIERYLNGIWYDHQPIPKTLIGLSRLYARWVKRASASSLTQTTRRPPVPLIAVGNLVAGGAGKTPVVRALALALKTHGHRVVVVARGVGARRRIRQPRWVSLEAQAAEVGDEACLLAKYAGLDVVVCANRSLAVDAAIDGGAEVIVSDDGLQNPTLQKSHTVCVVDGSRGFGNGHLLPAGPLREPTERLCRFDQVLVKGGSFQPGVPHVRFELRPVELRRLGDERSEPLASWQGHRVLAVCGIADPGSFQATLEALGMRVTLMRLADHHRYKRRDLMRLPEGRCIVVTEKDAVKLQSLGLPDAVLGRVYVLSVEADIHPSVLSRVIELVNERDCDD